MLTSLPLERSNFSRSASSYISSFPVRFSPLSYREAASRFFPSGASAPFALSSWIPASLAPPGVTAPFALSSGIPASLAPLSGIAASFTLPSGIPASRFFPSGTSAPFALSSWIPASLAPPGFPASFTLPSGTPASLALPSGIPASLALPPSPSLGLIRVCSRRITSATPV